MKMKFLDKFLIVSALVAVGILASWKIAIARLDNPTQFGTGDSITVGTITATTGTFSNLTVSVLASSSNYLYVPVNTTSKAARVMIQGASTENPFQIVSSTGSNMLQMNRDGDLIMGASRYFFTSDSGAHIQFSTSAGIIVTGLGSKLLLGGASPYIRAFSSGYGTGMRGNFGAVGGVATFASNEDARNHTSGTSTEFMVQGTFYPTSGAGDFVGADIAPTVSTSLTYAGANTTILRVSPFLKSATSTVTRLIDAGTNTAANGAGAHTSLFVVSFPSLVTTSVRVGINSSSPNFVLSVSGTVAFPSLAGPSVTDNLVCFEANGELRQQATNCLVSDLKKKENVKEWKKGLEIILALKPIAYDEKNGGPKDQIGLGAQDVAKVDKHFAVPYEDGKDYRTVDYQKLVVPLINSVKQLSAQNVEQQRQIDVLKDKVFKLETGHTPKESMFIYWLLGGAVGLSLLALLRRK